MNITAYEYIVSFGERNAGHDPVAIARTLPDAKRVARWWLIATVRAPSDLRAKDMRWDVADTGDGTRSYTLPNGVDEIVLFRVGVMH